MKFISYNLLKDKASVELETLTKLHQLDAVCLQEVNVNKLPKEINNLQLAIGTSKNRLGLAIYVDADKYSIEDADSFRLRDATYDKIAAPAHERLLGVKVQNKETQKTLSIGSFHASPLTALNAIRRAQIHQGLEKLKALGDNSPLVMLGDFNYPLFRRRLQKEIEASGFQLYTSDKKTYNYRAVQGHFDFAAAKDFNLDWMRTLQQGASDHLPILVKMRNFA